MIRTTAEHYRQSSPVEKRVIVHLTRSWLPKVLGRLPFSWRSPSRPHSGAGVPPWLTTGLSLDALATSKNWVKTNLYEGHMQGILPPVDIMAKF